MPTARDFTEFLSVAPDFCNTLISSAYAFYKFCFSKIVKKMEEIRLDKTVFEVVEGFDNSSDKEYWLSKTPEERFEFVEYFRVLNYGQNILKSRIQKFFEVVKPESS